MRIFKQSQISNLQLPENSYVYSITTTAARDDLRYDTNRPLDKSDAVLVTTSDDSLLALEPESLQILPGGHFSNVNKSLTVAKPYAAIGSPVGTVVTAGRDGIVVGWDLRSQKSIFRLVAPGGPKDPISALDCHAETHTIAAGTELEGNGPGDVSIFIWDIRQPLGVKTQFTESHTDTITELRFLPYPSAENSNVLLSGSTDGLVNIFDLNVADEDDAVLQVINHQSAIHHAGLIGEDIYASGTDEKLAFYPQQNPDMEKQDPEPCDVGDVREVLQCDYAMKLRNHPEAPLIAVGNFSDGQAVRLIPMNRPESSSSPTWIFDHSRTIQLESAHGEEIVRDYYVDDSSQVVFTCGEDGTVRQWRWSKSHEEKKRKR